MNRNLLEGLLALPELKRPFVIATQNEGKVREFKRLLEPMGLEAVSCKELKITTEVEETGSSFAENARIKAKAVHRLTGLPTIADDSGLCVDALGGAPGIYSARYAQGTDRARIEKLLRELENVPDKNRGAYFVCAICCILSNGEELLAEGRCCGSIAREPSGCGGFGYDPIFLTEQGSFAALTAQQKDAVSHRGNALRQFCEKLRAYLSQQNQGM